MSNGKRNNEENYRHFFDFEKCNKRKCITMWIHERTRRGMLHN